MRFRPYRLLVTTLVLGALLGAAGPASPQDNKADAEWVAKALEARSGSAIAEIGAGDGELTFALATVVGPQGKLFSNELNKDRLTAMKKKADESGMTNLTFVEGKEDVANLPDGCCDGIFMRNVYHHFGDPPSMNGSMLRALKPGGRLAVIDFTPPPAPGSENPPGHRGEDNHHGITRATLEKELKAAGFEIVSSTEVQRAVLVVARRPDLR